MSLLPVDEALARILARVPAPVAETVTLDTAGGRFLASPVVATHDQPPFPASAMDGYAVRTTDVAPGRPMRVVGTAQAGESFDRPLKTGECLRIFTGAPLPAGADAVIMQEVAERSGEFVAFGEVPVPGRSMRPRGSDFRVGDTLLSERTSLSPFSLLLAAAANVATLDVFKRPRVALLATGDELVAPGSTLGADQIVASNSFGLRPLLQSFCDAIVDFGIVGDDLRATSSRISEALASGPDILLTTGGASVGDRDFVREALLDLGVSLEFWRINMRPGKPLMFGTAGKTLVFGLPGNPVSAMVTAAVFVLPALRAWSGSDQPLGPKLRLPLAARLPANGSRRHYLRAFFSTGAQTAVRPILEFDSGHTFALAKAEALIIQPENDPGSAAGDIVDVLPLRLF